MQVYLINKNHTRPLQRIIQPRIAFSHSRRNISNHGNNNFITITVLLQPQFTFIPTVFLLKNKS